MSKTYQCLICDGTGVDGPILCKGCKGFGLLIQLPYEDNAMLALSAEPSSAPALRFDVDRFQAYVSR